MHAGRVGACMSTSNVDKVLVPVMAPQYCCSILRRATATVYSLVCTVVSYVPVGILQKY